MDIKLDCDKEGIDVCKTTSDFCIGDDLESAIYISLFSDRRHVDSSSDSLLNETGWWGDSISEIQQDQIGSRLFLLKRRKKDATVLGEAKTYALEALNWLVEDKIASSLDVDTSYNKSDYLIFDIKIEKHNGQSSNFSYLWDEI